MDTIRLSWNGNGHYQVKLEWEWTLSGYVGMGMGTIRLSWNGNGHYQVTERPEAHLGQPRPFLEVCM